MIKDLGAALFHRLAGDSAIATMVAGTGGKLLIFPVVIAQGFAGPNCLVYATQTELTDHHHQGPSGMVERRVQIDAWSTTRGNAARLADLVKHRLDGFRGVIASNVSPAAFPSLRVFSIFAEDMRESFDGSLTPKLYGFGRDYMFRYRER